MESRFHLLPGQTLANTKISDRAKELHVTGREWGRIAKHLDRKKDIQEALDREEEKRRYLYEGNKSMTDNWDNSLENIRKRKEEERLKIIEERKEERMQSFFKMREEQRLIREQYVKKIRDKMFRTSGFSRDLNSAFVESEVLYEREKQKEFKQFLQRHEDEEAAIYAESVKINAQKEVEEKKEKEQNLFDQRKEYGRYLRQLMAQTAAKEKADRDTLIMKETNDIINMQDEMARIKRYNEAEKLKNRRETFAANEKILHAKRELEIQMKQEEKEMNEVVEIYKKAKHRIDCLKKDTEKELQEAMNVRREAVAKLMCASEAARSEAEERQLKAAIAEKEAIDDAKIKARAEYDEQIRNERLDDRRNYLERKETEQKYKADIKKWEMVNRYKNDDVTRGYEEKKKREHWQKILDYRKVLLEQMGENEEERKRAKEILYLGRLGFTDEDDKFFEYADEVMELARSRGRSTYPIEKVILQYKKMYGLLPPGKKCNTCEDYNEEDVRKMKKSSSRELKPLNRRTCNCSNKNKSSKTYIQVI